MKSSFTRQSVYANDLAVPATGSQQSRFKGMTLLEITVVICVMMGLVATGLYAGGSIKNWRAGREAAESLRHVYTAQRMYLADNPTVLPSTITQAQLIPYLPNKADAMPTVIPLKGTALTIKVDVVPPVLTQGGTTYDPSGKTGDNLWDVAE